MIVMTIMGAVAGTSVYTLIRFRETLRLDSATTDLSSQLKTYLSRARNNTYTSGELEVLKGNSDLSCSDIATEEFVPDAIGIRIEDGSYEYIKCLDTNGRAYDYCCIEEDSTFRRKENEDSINYVAINSNCDGVIFEYSTGDLKTFQGNEINSIVSQEIDCGVRIVNTKTNSTKEIIFDASKNDVYIK